MLVFVKISCTWLTSQCLCTLGPASTKTKRLMEHPWVVASCKRPRYAKLPSSIIWIELHLCWDMVIMKELLDRTSISNTVARYVQRCPIYGDSIFSWFSKTSFKGQGHIFLTDIWLILNVKIQNPL